MVVAGARPKLKSRNTYIDDDDGDDDNAVRRVPTVRSHTQRIDSDDDEDADRENVPPPSVGSTAVRTLYFLLIEFSPF